MPIKTTGELEMYVKETYEKLKAYTEKEHIFKPIEVHFAQTTPNNSPGDFCYSDGINYYFCGMGDRGEVTIQETRSLFEVTYWIFKYQTSVMAFDYERTHRIEGKDCRRVAFQKQLELMGIFGDKYKQKSRIRD